MNWIERIHKTITKRMEGNMTNFEFIKTLNEKQMANLFVQIRLDAAEESDWREFFDEPFDAEAWRDAFPLD